MSVCASSQTFISVLLVRRVLLAPSPPPLNQSPRSGKRRCSPLHSIRRRKGGRRTKILGKSYWRNGGKKERRGKEGTFFNFVEISACPPFQVPFPFLFLLRWRVLLRRRPPNSIQSPLLLRMGQPTFSYRKRKRGKKKRRWFLND